MQFLQFVLEDFATGAAIPFGKCTVYLTGTTTLASLYDSGGSPISNPAIAGSNALVGFAAPDGIYDFQLANADGSFNGPKIPKQQIFDLGNKGFREKLLASRTYYVRNDGSDSNNGLTNTAGGAFLTLQKATDTVFNGLDLNGYNVTIQAADGTRTAGFTINAPQVGQGDIFVFGNVATPANCPVNVTGTDAFKVSNGATIWLRGFKPTTTTSGACVVAYDCATINMQAMDFGVCAASHMDCGQGSTISLDGAYTISGSAVSHWHVGSFGLIASGGTFAVTITGTPAFSSYFAGVAQGHIVVPGITFTGSATGPRYLAHHIGFIRAAGIDPALPGDVEGLGGIAGGGYVASVVNPWVIAPDTTLNNSVSIRGHNTGTNLQVPRFVVRADASGSGNFYCDGDNSYSSGETWFGNDARTVVASGTLDGATFYSKAALAAGFPVFEMSGKGAAVGYLRRRLSDGVVLQFNRDTTNVGSISVSTTATAYNTSSDHRLKEDARPINDALNRIAQLKPINFAWRINGERTDGFLAHELADVIPQAVTGEKDAAEEIGTAIMPDGNMIEDIPEALAPEGSTWERTASRPIYQQVDQSKLVPLLVAAVQELAAQIEAMRSTRRR